MTRDLVTGGKDFATDEQCEALRTIRAVAYAGLLTDEECEALLALSFNGWIASDCSGAGGLMGLRKLVITEAGREAMTRRAKAAGIKVREG